LSEESVGEGVVYRLDTEEDTRNLLETIQEESNQHLKNNYDDYLTRNADIDWVTNDVRTKDGCELPFRGTSEKKLDFNPIHKDVLIYSLRDSVSNKDKELARAQDAQKRTEKELFIKKEEITRIEDALIQKSELLMDNDRKIES
jgi:hypothetical protein